MGSDRCAPPNSRDRYSLPRPRTRHDQSFPPSEPKQASRSRSLFAACSTPPTLSGSFPVAGSRVHQSVGSWGPPKPTKRSPVKCPRSSSTPGDAGLLWVDRLQVTQSSTGFRCFFVSLRDQEGQRERVSRRRTTHKGLEPPLSMLLNDLQRGLMMAGLPLQVDMLLPLVC